jgi:hypothetical protein
VRFEWDPRKAAANLRAHRIRFAEAATVLEDAFALTREDPGTVNDALLEHIHGRSNLDAMRQIVREELAPYKRT